MTGTPGVPPAVGGGPADATTRVRQDGPVAVRDTVGSAAAGRGDPTVLARPGLAWRAERRPHGPATVAYRSVDVDVVEVAAWGPGAEQAVAAAPDVVGAGDDPSALRTDHPRLRELHRRHPGMRFGRLGPLGSLLPSIVLGQRVTGVEAARSWRRLVHRWGEVAPGPGADLGLHVAPAPGVLARLAYHELHPLGVERRRARTIAEVARHDRHIEALAVLPPVEAQAGLQTVPGVGPWTAGLAVQLGLGAPDVVVVGDLHLPSLVTWALAGERRGTDDRMLELLEPFAGQRARVVRLLAAAGDHPPRRAPRARIQPIARR